MKGLPETHVKNCKDKSFSLNRTLNLRDKFMVFLLYDEFLFRFYFRIPIPYFRAAPWEEERVEF